MTGTSLVFDLADRYVTAVAELDPIAATHLGVPGHDHELPDYSPVGTRAQARLAESTLAELASLVESAGSLTDDDRVAALSMRERLGSLIDMDNAVGLALAFARARGDTLVLVTADHGHGVDVYGTVDEQLFNALDGATRDPAAKQAFRSQQAVLEYDGAGWPSYVDADGDGFPENWGSAATNRFGLAFGFADVTDQKDDGQAKDRVRAPDIGHAAPGAGIFGPDDAAPGGNNHGFSVPRNIPTTGSPVAFAGMREASSAGVHTLQDVPLWAEGPGSDALRVSMENVDLFRVVAGALGAGE